MSEQDAEITPDDGWNLRRKARLRAAMQSLSEQASFLPLTDLLEEAARRVPLEAYDMSTVKSGAMRAWVDLRWNLSAFNHGGWVHFSYPGLRITRQGRQALADHPDPEDFLAAHNLLYAEWDHARKNAPKGPHGDPDRDVLHEGASAAHVYRAAGTVLTAWRHRDSAFQPRHAVWTPEATRALADYLSSAPHPLPSTMDGLEHDDARLLATEAMALLMAPFRDISSQQRRRTLRDMLLAHSDPPGLPPVLSGDLEHGLMAGGKRLAAEPFELLRGLVAVLDRWWSLSATEQDALWDDPWACRDLLQQEGADPAVSALLCLLAHPRAFTTLLRVHEREAVITAFADEVSTLTGDVEKDLQSITLALQRQQGGRGIDFHEPPFVQRWRGQEQGQSCWLIRGEVDQQNRVASWLQQGIVTITVGRMTALPIDTTQAELSALVDDLYGDMQVVKREAKKRDIVTFVLAMHPGDLVVTVDNARLRVGRVLEGETQRSSLGGSTVLSRPVAWQDGAPELADVPGDLRSRLRFTGGDVVNLTEAVAAFEALLDDEVEPDPDPVDLDEPPEDGLENVESGPVRAVLSCDTAALSRALHHADSSWLDELLVSLNERRQVILEGPPGTGKTYLVQKLLEACGVQPNDRAIVQFHPTYAYEDFVEGWRPTENIDAGTARLAVKPGPLKRLSENAAQSPSRPCVLVIDEINRANIAKVFGELYFLLEYRNAEIELLYSSEREPFRLPDNLFVIGTMNTADRSIALLDAAMRRRFVFLSMDTNEAALSGVLASWSAANSVHAGVPDLLDRLNDRMRQHGLDEDLAFGPSYFMRDGIGDPDKLRRVWRRELLPMLREHHYDNREQLDSWYPFERWLTELGLTGVAPEQSLSSPAAVIDGADASLVESEVSSPVTTEQP